MKGKKRWLLFAGVTMLFFSLLYFFLMRPAQKRFKLSHAEVEKQTGVLRNFLARSEGLPTEKEIGSLDNEIKILEEKYRDIENAIIHEVPKKAGITPVEFGKILYETKRNLLQETKDAGLEIPPDLGFKETIPTEEEVEDMVKELEAITFVIREAIPFRFGGIKKIKYPGVKAEGPWEKVGIELEVNGRFGNIVELLYHLSQREKIYIIKSLQIMKGGERITTVNPRRGLKAGAFNPRDSVEKEEPEKEGLENKTGEDRVSAIVYLESYNYIADYGN